MGEIITKLKTIFTDRLLRKRILIVLGALVLFRLLAAIPIPGIDTLKLTQFLNNNQFLGILNIFSGGGLSNLSIIMLGVGPYITASIIMQLLTIMVPRLKELYHEEGEIGRKKFTQYSRILTVPLAVIQGLSLMIILERQGILGSLDLFQKITALAVIVAGSLFLMWVGELMSEFGIGNGVSILIFAGIIAQIPKEINQLLFTFDPSQLPLILAFIVIGVFIVLGVVVMSEAERPIPVTYAKRIIGNTTTGGVSTYIPIRINQAGVMPIIFALSILLLPQLIGNLLSHFSNGITITISEALLKFNEQSWLYVVLYFVFVFVFTYFYTAVTFDPHAMATNLQKSGAFVPGIRPGDATEKHVSNIVSRVTFVGAIFLGIIAVLPVIIQKLTGITAIAIGGTALLIVVSVVLDILKRFDAQLSMREY